MEYVKRLRRQVERHTKQVLITGSEAEVLSLNEIPREAGYEEGGNGISSATGDYFQWWHWYEPIKYSARRNGLVPM